MEKIETHGAQLKRTGSADPNVCPDGQINSENTKTVVRNDIFLFTNVSAYEVTGIIPLAIKVRFGEEMKEWSRLYRARLD